MVDSLNDLFFLDCTKKKELYYCLNVIFFYNSLIPLLSQGDFAGRINDYKAPIENAQYKYITWKTIWNL